MQKSRTRVCLICHGSFHCKYTYAYYDWCGCFIWNNDQHDDREVKWEWTTLSITKTRPSCWFRSAYLLGKDRPIGGSEQSHICRVVHLNMMVELAMFSLPSSAAHPMIRLSWLSRWVFLFWIEYSVLLRLCDWDKSLSALPLQRVG